MTVLYVNKRKASSKLYCPCFSKARCELDTGHQVPSWAGWETWVELIEVDCVWRLSLTWAFLSCFLISLSFHQCYIIGRGHLWSSLCHQQHCAWRRSRTKCGSRLELNVFVRLKAMTISVLELPYGVALTIRCDKDSAVWCSVSSSQSCPVFLPSCWVHHSLHGGSQTFSFSAQGARWLTS